MSHSGPIDAAHAAEIGGAVLEMALRADTVANHAWHRPHNEGMVPGLYDLDNEPSSALVQISVSIASGIDHLRAYGLLLKRPAGLSTSLGTLSRGAVEAFGRAWHLVSAGAAETARYRAAILSAKEFQTSSGRGLRAASNGGARDPAEVERMIVAELAETAQGAVLAAAKTFNQIAGTAPGPTALAIKILEATEDVNGAEAYSRLSGVAHGETSHLIPRGVPTGEGTAGLAQTYEWVSTATRYMLDAARVTIDQVSLEWNLADDAERWRQTCDRSYARIGSALGE